MNWVAWKMLTGDRAKYLGTVFGVAFGVVLIAQQTSIFVGIIKRTASHIIDVREPDFWIMAPFTQNGDDVNPLSSNDLYRVRGVEGVQWATPLFKGQARAKTESGKFYASLLLGLDDVTLVGAPPKMLHGELSALRRPDAVIVDGAGYELLWPGEPVKLGREFEMNDRRAVLVGVCDVSSPFFTLPVIYTRYSLALDFVPPERRQLSFVVGCFKPGADPAGTLRELEATTKLRAYGSGDFFWLIIEYYLKNTGIPVNFGITILLGFLVGAAIAGQTFYLFTLENLKHFGALKAMGLSDARVVAMVLFQAAIVGALGYGIGIGLTAAFFQFFPDLNANLRGIYLIDEIALGTAATVVVIIVIASVMSVRRVLVVEPAIVMRS